MRRGCCQNVTLAYLTDGTNLDEKADGVVCAGKPENGVDVPKPGVVGVVDAPKAGAGVPKVEVDAPKAGVVDGAPKAGVEAPKPPKAGVVDGAPKAGVVDGAPKAGVVDGAPKAGVEAPKEVVDAPKAGVEVPKVGAVDGAPKAGVEVPKAGADVAPNVLVLAPKARYLRVQLIYYSKFEQTSLCMTKISAST